MKKFVGLLSIILLMILALGAFYGGICFILDSSGNKIGMNTGLTYLPLK